MVTATYGYALTKHNGLIAVLGIAGVILFALLDANYLRQEKAYRLLYATVANKARPVPAFTLDPAEAHDPPISEAPAPKKVKAAIDRWIPGRAVWLSWSIAPFYGGLLLIGVVIVGCS